MPFKELSYAAFSKITVLILTGLLSHSFSQMQVERLDRGLIAVRTGQNYYISWRLLANEPYTTGFNVYRGTTRLNATPVTGATIYTDINAPENSTYTVRAVVNAQEQSESRPARIIRNVQGSNAGYFDIPVQRPSTGERGGSYSPNDASAGDLTGDGEYEIVVKWDPSNAKDNSQSGLTDKVYLDAYTLSGDRLWRIDLGLNIRAGAHYTQFLVFDFDGDGKAEVMVKTAPGTKDGTGAFLRTGPAVTVDHSIWHGNASGYILEGPEYITVFEGSTGKELATENYWPARGRVSDWGDNYGNRCDRFNATVAYVDGQRPSAIFQRGYYTRMTMAAWDWRNGQLTRRWTFDSNSSEHGAYAGQGNHSIHVVDANSDGKHDIVTGSAVIGSDGKGMSTSGMGHGDATHCTHMIKSNPHPQIFMPHESGGHGVSFRHANSGTMIFNHQASGDIGRGCAAELDPERPGFHFWASGGLGLYNTSGQRVSTTLPNSINFVIWWNGDLSRELLDTNQIHSWSIRNNRATRLLDAVGTTSNNGTKKNPVLQADLFGDWREEVIFRRTDNSAIRVFTTTMPTEHRLYTFMHDPVYRVAISWQQSSYNQPPHPGTYIASDMDFPQVRPNVVMAGGDPIPQFTLTTVAAGEGTVTPATSSYSEGETVTVSAQAVQGWVFDHWSGDLSGSTNPATIVMDGNKTVTATFIEDNRLYYAINVTATPGGSITQTPEGQSQVEGTEVRFTAVAIQGWEFNGWSGDYNETDTTYAIPSLSSDVNLMASFMPINQYSYEAEYSQMYKTVSENTNTGYSGTGYANFDNEPGSYIELPIYVSEGGEKLLTITFANGTQSARTVSVSLNGSEEVALMTFGSTGSWTAWETKDSTFHFSQGINTIRITSVSNEGGPNVDKLDIGVTSPVSRAAVASRRQLLFNPGTFTLMANKPQALLQVEVFSITGRKVFGRRLQLDSGPVAVKLPAQEIKTGTYILKTILDGSVSYQKFNAMR